jgi:protein-S-isoprenylcysteine O-methyltransferase Ste14
MTRTTEAHPRVTPSAALAAGFAILAYLGFAAVVGYAVAFLADAAVPRTVDSGGAHAGAGTAALVDALLLALFAVQHSVMARPAFKRRWTRLVPHHMERSCYVLAASAVLALTFWQWRPIPAVVWQVHAAAARGVLWVLFGLGWLVVVAMTFAIDHFDMVGLRQVSRHLRGRRQAAPAFRLPLPYRLVRHPMMSGFFLALLATPLMTAGHLLFAVLSAGYIVLAVRFEERDLTRTLPEYREYAAGTPRFVPRPRPRPRPRRAGDRGRVADA